MFYTVRQRACFMGLPCEIALWVTLLARVISFADKLIACSVEIELIALLHLFYAAAIRIVEFPSVLIGDIICTSSTATASSTITTGATTHYRSTRWLRLYDLSCCEQFLSAGRLLSSDTKVRSIGRDDDITLQVCPVNIDIRITKAA